MKTMNANRKYQIYSLLAFSMFFYLLFPNVLYAKKLDMAYIEYPPYFYTNSTSGKADGFLIKLTSRILNRAGIDFRYEKVPVKRILKQMKSGRYMGSVGWFKTKEREEFVQYSLPIFKNKPTVAVILKKNINKLHDLTNLKEIMKIPDLKVAIIDGHFKGKYIDQVTSLYPDKTFYISGKKKQLLPMIAAERFDIFFIAPEISSSLIESCGYDVNDFMLIPLEDVPAGNSRYLIFSNTVSKQVVNKINRAIEEILNEAD
ncbi:substrate-binding periplasmic protein [Maridesulfovibrio zosterae]|uniref:substrate-binding periplasmic protein n=1 Tax=Maridesulfovibrio zosterae TaxID=82171 RepID=UPI000420F79B|nr:transporter substrate-binding domain-containing protein [Maridesulfovibrio zosterae]